MRDLNPHRLGNPFREFAYDARHPILFIRSRFLPGVKGELPEVDLTQRIAGVGLMVLGVLYFGLGLYVVIR